MLSGLSSLETLWLDGNELGSLPQGVFSGLSTLTWLGLSDNKLRVLPTGVFSGLTSLTLLTLNNNELSNLPEEALSELSSLTALRLDGNAVDPLPITVSLVPAGEGGFKAAVHTGAPFTIIVPVSVTNGTINGEATTVTIPTGALESEPLSVTRTSGTTDAVTVDIGTLSDLPPDNDGYALVKSGGLVLQAQAPAVDSLFARYDTNENGTIDGREVFRAVVDSFSGTLTTREALYVVLRYFFR